MGYSWCIYWIDEWAEIALSAGCDEAAAVAAWTAARHEIQRRHGRRVH